MREKPSNWQVILLVFVLGKRYRSTHQNIWCDRMTNKTQVLTRAYVALRARPGESWDDARERLGNEVAERVLKQVGCPNCGIQAHDLTRDSESLERCLATLPPWPATVLDPEYLDGLTVARSGWRLTQESLLNRAFTLVRSSMDYFGYAVARSYLDAISDAGFADDKVYPALTEELEELMAGCLKPERTILMAAFRDASWFSTPDVVAPKKAHVLRPDGSPMCGLKAVMCDPLPAFTVDSFQRCRRQGCKDAWPSAKGNGGCDE